MAQFCGRAEIAPDQREKFLQRFQQVQQQQQQQAPKQFTPLQFNSQTSGAPLSLPPQIVGPTAMSALQPSLTHSQSGQHILMSTGKFYKKKLFCLKMFLTFLNNNVL